MVAASKAKPPQVTGDVLRASGAMANAPIAPGYTPVGGASGPDFAGPPRATLRFSVLLYGGQNDRRVVPWILDRATDPQPAVRPVPRSGRAVATYVL